MYGIGMPNQDKALPCPYNYNLRYLAS